MAARLRSDQNWQDVLVCNISSRGIMLVSRSRLPKGTTVEIRRGRSVVIARVVWTSDDHFGVRSQDRIAIDEFIRSKKLDKRLSDDGKLIERRSRKRPADTDGHEHSRHQSESIQFAGTVASAVAGAAFIFFLVSEVLGTMAESVVSVFP